MVNSKKEKIIFNCEENPLVSIIISVHNNWGLTYSCLESINKNTGDISYEIILNDNASTDETTEISQYIDNIKVLRDGQDRGYLLGCNHAARLAKGKYILLLNNDTLVTPKWLSILVELIESDEKIGMVGPKMIFPDGTLFEAGGIVWKDASAWNYGKYTDPSQPQYNYVKEVDYISGACTLIRTSLWNDIGGYDERFKPSYYEDTDLAFEVRNRGYKVVYQPLSVIIHYEGATHGKGEHSAAKNYMRKNRIKFKEKWRDLLESKHFNNRKHVFFARDRSRDKKTILVIDHYIPKYDMDAGSRCIYNYLKLLLHLNLRVIFIGDNFVKYDPYATELEQLGIEILYGDWYAKNIKKWIKEHGRYLDYIYLIRPHISKKYIDRIKKYSTGKIFYHAIDLHHVRERRNYKLNNDPQVKKAAKRWQKIEEEVIEKSDVIHVVSSYEKKYLKKRFPNKVIRQIPIYVYEQGTAKHIPSYEKRKGILFVGHFNHPPNADAVAYFLKKILPRVKKKISDVPFYVVGAEGANPPKEYKKIKELHGENNIVVTGYVTEQELEEFYAKSRIAMAPLRFGAGVKGKIAEALYFRIPMITTSIGAEGFKGIKDYVSIKNNHRDFAKEVVRIYKNKKEWKRKSKKAKRYVEKNFSLQAAIKEIKKDL